MQKSEAGFGFVLSQLQLRLQSEFKVEARSVFNGRELVL